MGYAMRYFADGVVTLKSIASALKSVDPAFKIDGGDLMRGAALLGEIEINALHSDLFGEDLAANIAQLQQIGTEAARRVTSRLGGTQVIVTVQVIDGDRDPAVTWELLGPLWSVLPTLSTGLTRSDGQGFYDGSQLVVAIP